MGDSESILCNILYPIVLCHLDLIHIEMIPVIVKFGYTVDHSLVGDFISAPLLPEVFIPGCDGIV
jgi:hypothetical protein